VNVKLGQSDRHLLIGVFSRTTWASRKQKDKNNLDFNEARDEGVAVASAGPYANDFHLAPDIITSQHLIIQFLQNGCSS